jgi:predicted transcriptional regulator
MNAPSKAPQKGQNYVNPYESLTAPRSATDIARDIQLQKQEFDQKVAQEQQAEKQGISNPEFQTVFSLGTHAETVEKPQLINEIQSKIQEIQAEVKDLKAHSEGLSAEVEQVERAALQSLPEKPGVYHVRYLELLLQFLKGIKAKVGEARTWLSAMQSKKAKRGSAFAARSKKQGTQYSLSQELSASRNVM